MTGEVLKVEELVAGYGNNVVLRGISLSVKEGEKIVVMGPSGSGKSTLLKCIIRLVEPWKGEIFLGGIRVTDPKVDIRRVRMLTGFVFQNYNLFPHMTVIRNVSLPLEVVKKMPKDKAFERALEALKTVGMEEYVDKYPLELSGGQQQRVAIARALALKPLIFLLDEPTSALDPELREEVLLTLEKIAKQGKSMLIVTHEVDFAEDVASKVVVIDNGKILEEGEPWAIFYEPNKERTKRFLRTVIKRRAP